MMKKILSPTLISIIVLLCNVCIAKALTYNVTVPKGTNACYIAGEMNSWSHQEMTKVDDTHYTIDIEDATIDDEYKYCCGPSWNYVEIDEFGYTVANRVYSSYDVVEKWQTLYDPNLSIEKPKGDITIYLEKETAYSTTYLYAWDSSGNILLEEWPGTIMTETETIYNVEYWKYTFVAPEEAINIIFNNGYGLQTMDILGVSKTTFYRLDYDSGFAYEITPTAPIEKPKGDITIYLEKETAYPTTYLYAWDSSGKELLGSWPGTIMTETETIYNVEYWKYTFVAPEEAINILFNDGSFMSQTIDIIGVSKTTYYRLNSTSGKTNVTVVPTLDIIATWDIAEGAEVESFSEIIVEFNKPVYCTNETGATVKDNEGSTVATLVAEMLDAEGATADGSPLATQVRLYTTEPIYVEGAYSVNIPADMFATEGNEEYNANSVINFTVKLPVLPVGAAIEADGIYYKVTSSDDCTVEVSFKGSAYDAYTNEYTGSVVIPTSVIHEDITYKVTSIAASTFRGCTGLTSVTIPNSVTSIGSYTFYHCTGLTSVTIGNGITSIGEYAFSGCTGLTSVTIPNSVTSIGEGAFNECTGLTSITIGNGVTAIDDYVFRACTGLTSITIPNSVTSIGKYAFQGCTGLTSITVPNSVTSIGNYAFSECSSLKSLTIEDGDSELELGYNGSKEGLFYDCPIETLYLGRNLSYKTSSSSGYSPFYNKKELKTVTIGNSVTSIGSYVFRGCTGLTSVVIPGSVTSIGNYAFRDCSSLKSLTIEDGDSELKLGYNASNEGLFYDCPIETLYLGRNLSSNTNSSYDYSPFYSISKLKSVTIGNSVTSIGSYAFYNCSGITSIIIPGSVSSIGNYAFNNTSLAEIRVEATTPPTITRSFDSIDKSIPVYVPVGCIDVYRNAEYWEAFTNFIELRESVFIANGIYYKITSEENKTVEVTYKGSAYDEHADEYTGEVVIPESVVNEDVTYSVTAIRKETFRGCPGLTSVTIPASVTSIGEYAFSGCAGLTSIVVEEGNNVYDSRESCNAIIKTATNTLIVGCKNTVIPESVTAIGENAFYGCTGLASITIPEGVASIGVGAFSYCTGLTEIHVNATTPPTIYSTTFNSVSRTIPVHVPLHCADVYSNAEYWREFTNIIAPAPLAVVTTTPAEGAEVETFSEIVVEFNKPVYCTNETGAAVKDAEGSTIATLVAEMLDAEGATADGSPLATQVRLYTAEPIYVEGAYSVNIPADMFATDGNEEYSANTVVNFTLKIPVLPVGATIEVDGIYYKVTSSDDRTVEVAYKGTTYDEYADEYTGSVVIPASVIHEDITYKVTSIAASTFRGCTGLTSVTIPASVTAIGEHAFLGCSGLVSIVVEEGNNVYDSRESCNAIIEVSTNTLIVGCKNSVIPESVTAIGNYAFYGCTGLASITIPEGVASIGVGAFYRCSGLATITIPESVATIGNYTFDDCTGLTEIHVNATTPPTIGFATFTNVNKSIPVYVPAGCTGFYRGALHWHVFVNIIEVEILVDGIYYKVTSGENRTVEVTCKGSTYDEYADEYTGEVVIPASVVHNYVTYRVTAIGNYAFAGCPGLTSVTIPEGVTLIGNYAFSGCTGLTEITIPNSVTSIGGFAFRDCDGLTSITIPNSVTFIGSYAFIGCTGLTTVNFNAKNCTMPSSLSPAFSGCTNLSVVNIGDNVEVIPDNAFRGCSGLTAVTISDGVISIGGDAFYGCTSLTSVVVPGSVTAIGTNPFAHCTALSTITVEESNKVYDSRESCNAIVETATNTLIVGCKNSVIPESITAIGENAFYRCADLASITIPEGVTTIGENAFYSCTGLTEIHIEATTPPSIESGSFSNVSKSIPVYVPAGCADAYRKASYWSEFTNIIAPASLAVVKTTPAEGAEVESFRDMTIEFNKNVQVTSAHMGGGQTVIKNVAGETMGVCNMTAQDNIIIVEYDDVLVAGNYSLVLPANTIKTTDGSETLPETTINFSIKSQEAPAPLAVVKTSPAEGAEVETFSEIVVEFNKPVYCANETGAAVKDAEGSTVATLVAEMLDAEGTTADGSPLATQVRLYTTEPIYVEGAYSVNIPADMFATDGNEEYSANTVVNLTVKLPVLPVGTAIEADGIYYKVTSSDDRTIEVTFKGGYYGEYADEYTGEVVIPASVVHNYVTYRVTAIGNYAFAGCPGLTSVTIPEGVTLIGQSAYYGCTSLTSVVIPGSVTTIGTNLFAHCTALSTITVEEGNKVYDSRESCNAIVETATNTLIAGCKNSVIPESVTAIGENAFYGCIGLTSITIPAGVTTIGEGGFSYCAGLTSIILPNSIISIGGWAFEDCIALKNLTIGNGITEIANYAFYNCTGLAEIHIKASTPPAIGDKTFYYVDKSIPVHVPAGCADAYRKAEYWSVFSNIKEVEINFVSDNIHYKVTSQKDNTVEVTYKGSAYDEYTDEYTGEVVIPESVVYGDITYSVAAIGKSAFKGCTGLTSVVIPGSVTAIGGVAFEGCTALANVTIERGVTEIGDYAFYNCTALTSVTLPEGVATIGNSAFRGCFALTLVDIPSSTTSIGDYAFSYCTGLTQMRVHATTRPTVKSNTFNQVDKSIPLYVPVGSSGSYRSATQWNQFTNIIEIGENVFVAEGICYKIIDEENETVEVTYKGSTYDEYADEYIGSVVIPESVMYRGIAYRVTAIGTSAFKGCTGLTSAVIPASVTAIGGAAFEGCTALANVTIDSGVTEIGNFAFYNCKALTSVTLPESVATIGTSAFQACTGLTQIIVQATTPPTVKSNTFLSVDKYTLVYVPVGCVETYSKAYGWKDFAYILEIGTEPGISLAAESIKVRKENNEWQPQEVSLPISMQNTVPVVGMQCDIELPEGLTAVKQNDRYAVSLSTRAEGYRMETISLQDGRLRVLIYPQTPTPIVIYGEDLYIIKSGNSEQSATSRAATSHGQEKALSYPQPPTPISGSEGPLFTIKLKPNEQYSTTEHVSISHAVVITRDYTMQTIADLMIACTLQDGNTAGESDISDLADVESTIRIYATGNRVMVESPVAQEARIIMPNGLVLSEHLQAGHNEIPLQQGLYIVVVGREVRKVMVR